MYEVERAEILRRRDAWITAPTCQHPRPIKRYSFEARFGSWEPTVTITAPGLITGRIYLTEASYRRFVALANSGAYDVRIATDEHVGWQLRRKPE